MCAALEAAARNDEGYLNGEGDLKRELLRDGGHCTCRV